MQRRNQPNLAVVHRFDCDEQIAVERQDPVLNIDDDGSYEVVLIGEVVVICDLLVVVRRPTSCKLTAEALRSTMRSAAVSTIRRRVARAVAASGRPLMASAPAPAIAVNEPGSGSSADGKGEKGIDRSFERTGTPMYLGE
jgi:hypothetical protein